MRVEIGNVMDIYLIEYIKIISLNVHCLVCNIVLVNLKVIMVDMANAIYGLQAWTL